MLHCLNVPTAPVGRRAGKPLCAETRKNPRMLVQKPAIIGIVVVVLSGGFTLALLTVPGIDAGGGSARVTQLLSTVLGGMTGVAAAVLPVVVTPSNSNAYVPGLAELGGEVGRTGQAPRWLPSTPSTVPRRSLAVPRCRRWSAWRPWRSSDGRPSTTRCSRPPFGSRSTVPGSSPPCACSTHDKRLVGRDGVLTRSLSWLL